MKLYIFYTIQERFPQAVLLCVSLGWSIRCFALSLCLLSFLIQSPQVLAGSNDARIVCESSSGRTNLELYVLDVHRHVSSVNLEIDGKAYAIVKPKDAFRRANHVVVESKSNTYFAYVEDADHYFTLRMVPGTEIVTDRTNIGFNSTFTAIVDATDPRGEAKIQSTPKIWVYCKLTYSI